LDPPAGVDELAELYNLTLVGLLDKHAPVKSKCYVDHSDCPWFCEEVSEAKEKRRLAEIKWRKSGLEIDRQLYRSARNSYVIVVKKAKSEYIQEQLASASRNPKKVFDIVNNITCWVRIRLLLFFRM
jgi:hypothetical protein